jgi:hypothetical protein
MFMVLKEVMEELQGLCEAMVVLVVVSQES